MTKRAQRAVNEETPTIARHTNRTQQQVMLAVLQGANWSYSYRDALKFVEEVFEDQDKLCQELGRLRTRLNALEGPS